MRGGLGTVAIVSSLVIMAVVGGCSDTFGGDGTSPSDGDGPVQSPDECSADETYHPITEKCVSDTSDDAPTDDSTGDGTGGDADEIENCGPGAIKGLACRPNGSILPSAQITVEGHDCDGEFFESTTTAAEDGLYELDGIPAGEHTLTISSGSFDTRQMVSVVEGATTDLTQEAAKVCIGDHNVDIAVIEGSLDDIGAILNRLDVRYDVVGSDQYNDLPTEIGVDAAAGFLGDIDEMMAYDILFIECGSLWTSLQTTDVDRETITSNIRSFVEAGNSIYASDWAHPFIQLALPEAIDFYDADESPLDARAGENYSEYNPLSADVVSDEMSMVLGEEIVDLQLMSGWSVARQAGVDAKVHFAGDVELRNTSQVLEDAPLMLTYSTPESGGGRAVFTSFHNGQQTDEIIEEIMEYMIFQL